MFCARTLLSMPKRLVTSAHFAGENALCLGAGQRMKCRALSAHMEFANLFFGVFLQNTRCLSALLPSTSSVKYRFKRCIRHGVSKDKKENEPSCLAAAGSWKLNVGEVLQCCCSSITCQCVYSKLYNNKVAAETLNFAPSPQAESAATGDSHAEPE